MAEWEPTFAAKATSKTDSATSPVVGLVNANSKKRNVKTGSSLIPTR